jgi:hypothetical protein
MYERELLEVLDYVEEVLSAVELLLH